jgi:tetratricopeptide (TPR) repeat protein
LSIYGHFNQAQLTCAAERVQVALSLDPASQDSYIALGTLQGRFYHQWREAESSLRHAVELDPAGAEAHYALAQQCLLPLGRLEEAVAESRLAVELEPLAPHIRIGLAFVLSMAGQYEEAAAIYGRELLANPASVAARFGRAILLDESGDPAGAVRECETLFEQGAASPSITMFLCLACARAGFRDRFLNLRARILSGSEPVTEFARAALALAAGEVSVAVAALERAVQRHDPNLHLLAVSSGFASLRNRPEFRRILAAAGLAGVHSIAGVRPQSSA